jgi:hypothetical protein
MSQFVKRVATVGTAWCAVMVLFSACVRRYSPPSKSLASASGAEASFSLPIPRSRDSAWAEVFVPAGVPVVRAAVVFINRELDRYAYDDRDWRAMCRRIGCALVRVGLPRDDAAGAELQRVRNASLGGDSAVLTALQLSGDRTAHPELQRASVVLFGFSAAGNFGPTFAALHPDRTIGFIRYHSNLRGLRVDTSALASVPSLTITGARDETAGSEDSRTLWRVLRGRGAPVAYVNHVAQSHLSIDGLVEAGGAMRNWTEALILRRTSAAASLLSLPNDGWIIDDSTGEVRAANRDDARAPSVSWVPDAQTAFALRQLKGMCAQVPLRAAIDLLGAGTKLESEDASVCHFVQQDPRHELWVSASSHDSDSAAVAWLRQAQSAIPLARLGDAAILMVEPKNRCTTIGAARSTWTFYVSACGDGFAVVSDSTRLKPIARQVLGESRN